MNCLKCGKEVDSKDIFCRECQEDMAKNPVKPGTTVFIPSRAEAPAAKQHPKRKPLTQEQQLKKLKKANRRLTALVILLALMLSAFLLLFQDALEDAYNALPKGQNYSAETTIPAE